MNKLGPMVVADGARASGLSISTRALLKERIIFWSGR